MLVYESLHNHTTASDGLQSHLDALKTAEQSRFGVMAFTDHDTLPDKSVLQSLRAYPGPVKWLLGCEISSGLPKELGGGPIGMFHILGLFTDPTNVSLLQHCEKAGIARVERMEKIVQNLNRAGFTVSVNDCLAESGGEAVGRPHIAQALLKHESNLLMLAKLERQMGALAKHDSVLRNNYLEMRRKAKVQGDLGRVFGLLLGGNAFLPGIYVDYQYWTDMDESVRLIRGAGGVAILAHWGTIKHAIHQEMLGAFLRDGRLDGVELRTGFIGPEVDNDTKELEELIRKTDTIWTIGIDGHRAQDIESFGVGTGALDLTIGQTAKIIEKHSPDLSWSNL